MRIPIGLTLAAALVALVVIVIIGTQVIAPTRSLITDAAFAPDTITPNADGDSDVTVLTYGLSRNAHVTVDFTSTEGKTYSFRQNEARIPDHYEVAFSGVVDGFTLPGEAFGDQKILRRLIPDGVYTWKLQATDDSGATDQRTGTLTVKDGDAVLPQITEFTVFPTIFTPNQDGISDRASINAFVSEDSTLTAYLVGQDGTDYYLSERQEDNQLGKAGRHLFDYDGGVDNNVDPPPDGDYQVIATAQDAVGQEIERSSDITIQEGGKPYAQIVPQPVGVSVVFATQAWDDKYLTTRDLIGALVDPPDDPASLAMTTLSLNVGDMLVFKLTVDNYGKVPIRTTGPAPGTVYQWEQRASTLGLPDEAGAWRVGIDCTTAMSDYPWRWALGDDSTLQSVTDPATGNVYHYLPAGAQSVVWGAVRMTDLEAYNPQDCWAGLIHEQVSIDPVNQNVGARQIELVKP